MIICVKDDIPPAPIPWIALYNYVNALAQYAQTWENLLLPAMRMFIDDAAPHIALPTAKRSTWDRRTGFRPKTLSSFSIRIFLDPLSRGSNSPGQARR